MDEAPWDPCGARRSRRAPSASRSVSRASPRGARGTWCPRWPHAGGPLSPQSRSEPADGRAVSAAQSQPSLRVPGAPQVGGGGAAQSSLRVPAAPPPRRCARGLGQGGQDFGWCPLGRPWHRFCGAPHTLGGDLRRDICKGQLLSGVFRAGERLVSTLLANCPLSPLPPSFLFVACGIPYTSERDIRISCEQRLWDATGELQR